MSSDIPYARRVLEAVLHQKSGYRRGIYKALKFMRREFMLRKAPRKRVKLTPDIKRKIWALARTTKLSQSEIAHRVGLGSQAQGRVSEVLRGRR